MEKKCFKCGLILPIEEFYAHPEMKDGHLNKCKECTRQDVRVRRIGNPGKLRDYEVGRSSNPDRKAYQKDRCKRIRENRPDRYRAQTAVNNAVRDGRIIKPNICEICNCICKPLAHHDDYSKPLKVLWVCPKCHRDIHHG